MMLVQDLRQPAEQWHSRGFAGAHKEPEVDRTSANVAKLHAVTNEGLSISRTDDSIQPSVILTVVDIDQQSAQFACELTISNLADDDFQVGQIRPRLPVGVTLNEAVDSGCGLTTISADPPRRR